MCDFDTTITLRNLHNKKNNLKNRYKHNPRQYILFDILNLLKEINALEKKL
jgi:hypothetical protein